MTIKFRYEIEIEVDVKNVSLKYPNYKFNYSHPKELADAIAFGVECEGDTDMAKDGMREWGNSIKVKEVNRNLILEALEFVGFVLTDNMSEEEIVLNAIVETLQTGNYKKLANIMKKLG